MVKQALLALLSSFLILALPIKSLARSIRVVEADESKVVTVNTALGYSTIIQFSTKPISAVLGDQDAFKLEYVGNSITIKPLIPHAKSNLFIFTEYDRFNCTLKTVSARDVDYIVKLSAKRPSQPMMSDGVIPASESTQTTIENQLVTRRIGKMRSFAGFTLKLTHLNSSKDSSNPRSVTLIDFELSSKKKAYSFQPASLGVKQNGKFVTIESIYLDSLELLPGHAPVRGKIAILNQDLKRGVPLTLIFAVYPYPSSKKVSRIEVSTNEKGK